VTAPAGKGTPPPGTITITQDSTDSEASQQGTPISVHVDKDGDIKLSNQPTAPTAGPHIVGTLSPISVGGVTTLHVVDENGHTLDSDSSNVLWQGKVSSGIAFVNQRGQLTAMTTGSGTATALYQGRLLTFPVQVVASNAAIAPPRLTLEFAAAAAGAPLQNQLTVRLSTAAGAPIARATVIINCVGGTADDASVVTNPDGYATTTITWSDAATGSVSATTGTLPAVSLNRPQ